MVGLIKSENISSSVGFLYQENKQININCRFLLLKNTDFRLIPSPPNSTPTAKRMRTAGKYGHLRQLI